MNEHLKPCPRCGNPAITIIQDFEYDGLWNAACMKCHTRTLMCATREEAIDEWNASHSHKHLHWTEKLPTEPGWYWYDDEEEPSEKPYIVHIETSRFDKRLYVRGRSIARLDESLGRWAGPIEEPKE